MHRLLLIGCATGLLIGTSNAADGPTARDRYFEAARNNDSGWIGIRTSVLLLRGTKGNTTLREVGESADFHNGDQFRLRLQANGDGYAYLIFQSPDKGVRVLYPAKDAKPRSNQVRAFEERTLPGRSKEWMKFDNKPAIEGLYLVFSPRPVAELERAIGDSGQITTPDFESLVESNGHTASMVFDEQEDDNSGIIPATYYVEKIARERGFLIRKIDLVHRNSPKPKDSNP